MNSALFAKLESVAEALDRALGDTDLTHIEDDEELREVAPVQWACSQINKLLYDTRGEVPILNHSIDTESPPSVEDWTKRPTAQSESAPIVPTKEMIEAGRVAIMRMLGPKLIVMPKPSIAELEAILNADGDGRNINIEPDGSVTELKPRTTTASEVAKTAYEAMVAAAMEGK